MSLWSHSRKAEDKQIRLKKRKTKLAKTLAGEFQLEGKWIFLEQVQPVYGYGSTIFVASANSKAYSTTPPSRESMCRRSVRSPFPPMLKNINVKREHENTRAKIVFSFSLLVFGRITHNWQLKPSMTYSRVSEYRLSVQQFINTVWWVSGYGPNAVGTRNKVNDEKYHNLQYNTRCT